MTWSSLNLRKRSSEMSVLQSFFSVSVIPQGQLVHNVSLWVLNCPLQPAGHNGPEYGILSTFVILLFPDVILSMLVPNVHGGFCHESSLSHIQHKLHCLNVFQNSMFILMEFLLLYIEGGFMNAVYSTSFVQHGLI